jgi:hypothetical protein
MSGKHTLRDDDPDRWGQGDDFSDEDFKNPYEDREPDKSDPTAKTPPGVARVLKHGGAHARNVGGPAQQPVKGDAGKADERGNGEAL